MLQLSVCTDKDRKEAAAIERKRQFEDERKKRIFNARNRIIGIDRAGLEEQLFEKQKISQAENESVRKFHEEEIRQQQVLRRKETELAAEKRRVEAEINDYRARYQQKEDSREFDLNDQKYNQKSLPARIGDNDPRLGVSSAQKFLGEDLTSSERLKAQKEQQKAWLQQQIFERKSAEEERQKSEKYLQDAFQARERRVLTLESAERASRRQIQAEIVRFNLQLASQQKSDRLLKKKQEEEDNLAEIYNCLTSGLLTENPELANSSFGINRKIPAMYRGMLPEEINEYRQNQLKQRKETNQRKEAEELLDDQWSAVSRNFEKVAISKEQEIQAQENLKSSQIKEENQQLAMEQKAKKDYIDKVVYTNRPTSEYFAQFNTTSR